MPKSAWQQPGRFNNKSKAPRLDDLLPLHKFKSGVFYNLRFVGSPLTFGEHWIRIITNAGKETGVRKLCLSYDHASGDFKGKCPYCDMGDQAKVVTLQNAIERKLQKNEPARRPKPLKSETALDFLPWADKDAGEFYFKEKDSETWTPVIPLRLTSSPSQRINDYAALNKHTDKKGNETVYGPEDIDYGFDLQIKYDENQSAANAYFVNKAKNTPLTDEELDYPIYDLMVEEPEKVSVAEKNADELSEKLAEPEDKGGRGNSGGNRSGGRDDRGGGGKSRRDAKGYLGDIDEDDTDDRPGIDDNNDDDLPPARGKSGGRSRRDEDDAPPARGKSGGRSSRDDDEPPARSARGRSRDDDEDEAPPARGRGRASRDDEDDAPPARGRSRSRDDDEDDAPPARGRGKTSSRMDEDDEPPARGRGRAASRNEDDEPPARGRSRRDEDDEPAPRGRSGGGRSRRDDGLDLD